MPVYLRAEDHAPGSISKRDGPESRWGRCQYAVRYYRASRPKEVVGLVKYGAIIAGGYGLFKLFEKVKSGTLFASGRKDRQALFRRTRAPVQRAPNGVGRVISRHPLGKKFVVGDGNTDDNKS
jgi:hypothetical protein